MENLNMLREGGLSEKDMILLQEKFIIEYAKKKGWDTNFLTQEQLLEIKQQKQFQTPIVLG